MKLGRQSIGKCAVALALGLSWQSPAAANAVDRIAFGVPPMAQVIELESGQGWTRIGVVSNSEFTIYIKDAVGEVRTSLVGDRLGPDAQIPGPRKACVMALGRTQAIYTATRRTAARAGSPSTQMAAFEIRHSARGAPQFSVQPFSGPKDMPARCP